MVVRIERDSPPHRTDALEAAARAALLMLTSDRPGWRAAIEAWNGGAPAEDGVAGREGQRIRKVVRRARGAEWRRASTLDGLDVVSGTAEVRVYPPIPIDGWPPELSRLQVSGTELVDPAPPGEPVPGVPLVLLSPLVEMTAGKAMAQAAHAAQLGWRALSRPQRQYWREGGFGLAVRDARKEQWAAALAAGAPVVHDGGFTEVEPDTQTAAFVSR